MVNAQKGKNMNETETKYAYSLKTERVKEKDFPYAGEQITNTSELLQFVKKLQDADIEKFLVLYTDAQNQLVCIQVILGTVNQAVVYPREIFKHAILSGACAVILVHNHPSGHVKPSDADIRLTKTIQEAAKVLDIFVHDHVIIGSDNRFFSFREAAMM